MKQTFRGVTSTGLEKQTFNDRISPSDRSPEHAHTHTQTHTDTHTHTHTHTHTYTHTHHKPPQPHTHTHTHTHTHKSGNLARIFPVISHWLFYRLGGSTERPLI